jgi:hypothetical protein
MNIVRDLGPDFFQLTNREEYYAWYLPPGRRGRLFLSSVGIFFDDGVENKLLWKILAPPDIVGLSITGYLLSPSEHTGTQGKMRFITDTMYDLSDPYTGEEAQFEYDRVTTLRGFVESFHTMELMQITAQDMLGISLQTWGDRIDAIWQNRVRKDYPIVGIVFWSRTSDNIYEWRDVPFVATLLGERVILEDMSTNLRVDNQGTLSEYSLAWNDLSGAGITVIIWFMNEIMNIPISRNNFISVIASLDEEKKKRVEASLLLSPRQQALLN